MEKKPLTISQLLKEVERVEQRKEIKKLQKKGWTNVSIAEKLEISEATVRRRVKDD
jgi:DNA-binding NarL/FixJ family response regulator